MRKQTLEAGCWGIFVILSLSQARAAELPGFKLDGTRWTYESAELKMDGILVKPEGDGPFPAVLISHGLGGSAESFGMSKAREIVRWGAVCIAPNYTHSRNAMPQPGAGGGRQRKPGGAGAGQANHYGASDENLRRAAKCLEIVAALPYVDASRLAAYGHSMGGFVTVGLAAREPQRLKAAAISGSGIAPRAGYAAPSSSEADKIRTPFCIFHGANDTTVRPDQSASLKEALDRNHVPNERHLYEGVGHPVDQQKTTEMYDLMHKWFARYDLFEQ